MRQAKVTEILPERFGRLNTACESWNKISSPAFFSWRLAALCVLEGMQVEFEGPEPTLQPSMTERAMDAATDVSQTVADATARLRTAVERLGAALDETQSGPIISALRHTTRQAPLISLFAAFLLGTAFARAQRR
jgi:hypothetical protein